MLRKPYMRIPYTDVLAAPTITPSSANTLSGAVAALQEFLTAPSPKGIPASTLVLTGAGLITKLENGTGLEVFWDGHHYTRPDPTRGHFAIKQLGDLGLVHSVITQNVDSFHPKAHPSLPTIELHGYLRSLVCVSCHEELPRDAFQEDLARLNPAWTEFLQEITASGALDTENPEERRRRGMRTNPDGDVYLPDAPYTTFRYPACPRCLAHPPPSPEGGRATVEVDSDGAWRAPSTAGILKPAVTMFGENIRPPTKIEAEKTLEEATKLLVLGTSLATYSAWRLAKHAKDRGIPIAIANLGGVRGEDAFFKDLEPNHDGTRGARVEMSTDALLPALVKQLQASTSIHHAVEHHSHKAEEHGASVFKDMMS
ncbi:Sir2 family protein [Apiospora marii]|uniref:Sir2 family protein n=1 Tax=Apiospora marii TaxID=335849 RepID=A0ABR1S7C2_9PEZI